MLGNDIPFYIAFGAGFLSFLSPCILPLIPAYITYITGSNAEDELSKRKFHTFSRTIGFVLGFSIIFMIIGISVGSIGQTNFIKENKNLITRISGLIILVFGLNMIGVFKLEFLNKQKNIKLPKIKNWFSSMLMGMAFAAGWTPCFGPILGSIVVYAANQDTALKGFYLLGLFSLGLAIPFILTSLFINLFNSLINRFDKFLPHMSKISGFILILFGLMISLGYLTKLSNILIKYLPSY